MGAEEKRAGCTEKTVMKKAMKKTISAEKNEAIDGMKKTMSAMKTMKKTMRKNAEPGTQIIDDRAALNVGSWAPVAPLKRDVCVAAKRALSQEAQLPLLMFAGSHSKRQPGPSHDGETVMGPYTSCSAVPWSQESLIGLPTSHRQSLEASLASRCPSSSRHRPGGARPRGPHPPCPPPKGWGKHAVPHHSSPPSSAHVVESHIPSFFRAHRPSSHHVEKQAHAVPHHSSPSLITEVN